VKLEGMTVRRVPILRRMFATAAMIGVVIYVVVDVVLQTLPPHYSVLSDAESDLAVGPFGWIMSINFFGRAILSGCAIGAIVQTGPRSALRRAGLALFGIAGVCSGLLAFFPTDVPVGGDTGIRTATLSGRVHLTLASTGFVFALAAFVVLTCWIRRTRLVRPAYRAAVCWVTVAGVGLVALAVCIAAAPDVLGLAERVCLVGILGWAFAVCRVIRRLR
jgi:hypothetical membrane protein